MEMQMAAHALAAVKEKEKARVGRQSKKRMERVRICMIEHTRILISRCRYMWSELCFVWLKPNGI